MEYELKFGQSRAGKKVERYMVSLTRVHYRGADGQFAVITDINSEAHGITQRWTAIIAHVQRDNVGAGCLATRGNPTEDAIGQIDNGISRRAGVQEMLQVVGRQVCVGGEIGDDKWCQDAGEQVGDG